MKIDFCGKTVLITGATGGIGRQIATDFERLGADLILTGIDATEVETLNAQATKEGRKVKYYCVDFLNKDSFDGFLSALNQYLRIDVCVNNAGANRTVDFVDSKASDFDDIIGVNLRAPFLLSAEVAKKMKQNKYGRIVNIASILGHITRPKKSAYTTSKAGLIGLTKSMAVDLAPHNILANSVSPGFVMTDMTRRMMSAQEINGLNDIIPVGRLATPADISNVVLFLSSELNTYISGQNIFVDGGYVNI
ncbi:MAG: SDR family oxidoreductase [Parcubacteria group bacterium]